MSGESPSSRRTRRVVSESEWPGRTVADYLEEAVREYLGLIAQVPRSSDPRQWAMTQNNLGLALGPGRAVGRSGGLRRLSEAVEAYRQALTVRTRDDLPQQWAMTQTTWACVRALGERLGGPEGLRRLNEAVEAYRQALTVCHPRRPAPAIGPGPGQPGQRALGPGPAVRAGPEGLRRLNEAAEAYRQALTVRTRDDLPQDWARTQNNLGGALGALGERMGGPEGLRRLNEAVEAYRQALTVSTRNDLPQQWATTQNNLGIAL